MSFSKKILIQKKKISNNNQPFIIAEIGSNFNQNLKLAKKMINTAKNVVQMQ